jgi:hypothetical protein
MGGDEKAFDNYFLWDLSVKNEIDRSAPYVGQVLPQADTEDVDEETLVQIGFSKSMWYYTLVDGVGLNEYPSNVCANGSTEKDCGDNTGVLDTLWFKLDSEQKNDKTVSTIKHRSFGPNGLDLYYFPSVPSTVKSQNQNCLYPGYGPIVTREESKNLPLDLEESKACEVEFGDNGSIVSVSSNCTPSATKVSSSTDSGCAYTTDDGSGSFVSKDVDTCIGLLESVSDSAYKE